MATSHSLSVLTNSCVKTPLNRETGLSASLKERPETFDGRLSQVYYDDYDTNHLDDNDILQLGPRPKGGEFDAQSALLQLSNLSDEEFYKKLLHLKSEQRKILERCEKLYIEKHHGEDDVQPYSTRYSLNGSQDFMQTTVRDGLDTGVAENCSTLPAPLDGGCTPPRAQTPPCDNVKDLYAKPPSGRQPSPLVAKSLTSPPVRPSSAPLTRPDWSIEDFRHTTLGIRRSVERDNGISYLPDDTVSEPYRPKDNSFAMSQIDDMWDNFSIEEYAPRQRQRRASSGSMRRKEEKKRDDWRHRLTVPQPFSMTVRESKKEKTKSQTLQEFERQRIEKEREEENECKKKFKASPVPAHVYLPLYDEISEKSEERRRYIKQYSEDLLKSQQKPFSFTKREEDKKMHQRLERECSDTHVEKKDEVKKNGFKAKPVPKYIFDNSIDDKLMEEEEYRKIRMKMRAKELLRSASLPPNMEAREKMIEQQKREMEAAKAKKRRQQQRPKVNHQVPNYDALYRQFQQELQRRKASREATVTRPFRLETHRVVKDKQNERPKSGHAGTVRENRWPYKDSNEKKYKLGHISVSLDSLPAKSTRSFDVRTSQTKSRKSQLTEKEQQEVEDERRRRVREIKLRRYIQERTPKSTPRESYEEKKKRMRQEEKTRQEEYERELEEMKDRVNKRPLLFEQETQTNAKKAAEKKFNATLKSVGLDEDFINSRGSRSASFQDNTDDYDDDFDETYVKGDRSASPAEA